MNNIYKTDFVIKSEKYPQIKYKILSLIPIKYINDKFTEVIKDYRVRYKLIHDACQSPISESRNLTEFREKELKEIMEKSGVPIFEGCKIETTEVIYID